MPCVIRASCDITSNISRIVSKAEVVAGLAEIGKTPPVCGYSRLVPRRFRLVIHKGVIRELIVMDDDSAHREFLVVIKRIRSADPGISL